MEAIRAAGAAADSLFAGHRQWVCTVCGYNMIGDMPAVCPLCGVAHEHFIAWDEAERRYRVGAKTVTAGVTQLVSVPRLGFEHAAYRVETEGGVVWIDCPSAFNRDLAPANALLFTHSDFLGASNQYRTLWGAPVYIHRLDAASRLAQGFEFDHCFDSGFEAYGVEAFHIGGHTPGFTVYRWRDAVFVCDYAFPPGAHMRLNPNGPQGETRRQAERLLTVVTHADLRWACGYNFVTDVRDYARALRRLAGAPHA